MDMQMTHTREFNAERSHYILLWLAYISYATLVLMPVGAAISLYQWWRHRQVSMASYEPYMLKMTHYKWLGRTFVWGGVAMMVAAGHFYYGVGIITAVVTMIWFVHRLVTGITALIRHEPAPVAELTLPRQVTSVKFTYN